LQSRYPHARRVRVMRARLLMEADRREEAAEALRELSERYPEDRDLRFSLALYGLERGNTEPARAALSDLLAEGYRPNDVNLFLARAAEDAGDPHAAIDHYLAISGGDKMLQAQVQAGRLMFDVDQAGRAARHMERLRAEYPEKMPSLYAAEAEMLASHGQAPEALDILNEALVRLPDQADLLYARAMVAEKLDNLAQLEADLRRMLELKPDDPTAMNALGYTLADHGQRLDEARQLVEAAYAQRPEDPAIIDSMGWVHYRLGQLDTALTYLRQAWEAFPDHEVAAHYGEVLWQLGQRDEARRVWRDALVEFPGSEKIRETVERLTGDPQP
ncbi:MAG: tetratricopeptide repeat protein, partial [Alcanivoracaceae bacterium]